MLLTLGVLFVTVVLIFPLVFEPVVQLRAESPSGNPFSIQLLVANQNMTPVTDVEYTCEVSTLTKPGGAEVTGAGVLIRGTIRTIPGRRAIAEPCETAFVEGPVQTAEFKVTISYRMYPLPKHRTSVHYVAAQVDRNGRVTGWRVK